VGSPPSLTANSLNIDTEGKVRSPSGVQPKLVTPVGHKLHVSEMLNYEPDAWGIPDKWDSLDEYLNADHLAVVREEHTSNIPTNISGDPDFQEKIRSLLVEYSCLFRRDVSPTPALIPPMEIKVDRQKWNTVRGNMGVPPRIQSQQKNCEIQRQCEKLIELNVMKRSDSNRYSQVHLVPKPGGDKTKWRFCIDYVLLNSCCEGDGWNIPNIQQMLHRVGSHKPKYFAVMDLTSGYHQAPLSKSSQPFTAFITFMGILDWTRVPMGLLGAASYFQRMLATIVLIGLIYTICELYIDDILVFAQCQKSYIERLRLVFERLKKHNITLNPDKCKFGLSSVVYVGHQIDATGLSFSSEKLDDVLAISPPTYAKELRSFLGLASFFREHVRDFTKEAKPLQAMLGEYEKKRKLVWSPQAEQAFENVKLAIRKCPKLFFVNDNAPIFLHTDASDYGLGAYLFQVIDGGEIPIQFMSKSLTVDEVKWSTIEKECYAIVFSLDKFHYLLSDRPFTIRTDHDNLRYINDPPSPKVRRWKIAMQGYDCIIEHIPGKNNIAADGFSRLLPITKEVLCILKGSKIPDDKYHLISQVHNTKVGHHMVERTLSKLKSQNLEWKEMRDHVRKFIDNCPCCQKMSNIRVPIQTHPYTLATYRPMEVIHMDTLSMGVTNDEKDKYLLVLIDSCSRWVELYPIPDLSAETAAKKIFEFIGRYGHPSKIMSDNGSQFSNKLLDELCVLTGIEKLNSTPYSHEENGLVERANKEILRHVRSILFDKGLHKEWNLTIPIVQRILNSQKSSVTGCRPADLVLANAANLEQGIYMPTASRAVNSESLSEWHSKRIALQKKSFRSNAKTFARNGGREIKKGSRD
jgi:cleavage and polyadenylation specificity factor subunit 1